MSRSALTRLFQAALLLLAAACGRAHTACPPGMDASASDGAAVDGAGPDRPTGRTRTIPWDGVEIRFLGLADLMEPGGDDVELRWRIRAPGSAGRLTVEPRLDPSLGYVEQEVVRSPGWLDVRLRFRLAPDATALGARVATGAGLRVYDPGLGYWDTQMRSLGFSRRAGPDHPPLPHDPGLDGSVQVELVAAPDVPLAGRAWMIERGVTYDLLYRVHNWSERRRELVFSASTGETPGEGERFTARADVEPGGSFENPVELRLDTLGPCTRCLSAGAYAVDDPGPSSDAVGEPMIDVVPRAP